MYKKSKLLLILLLISNFSFSQAKKTNIENDSLNSVGLKNYSEKIIEFENQRIKDSIKKSELELRLVSLKTTDNKEKENLEKQLKTIEENEKSRIALKKAKIDSLRLTAKGFPVLSESLDTLFYIYSKIGATLPKERASNVTKKIKKLFDDDFLKIDSILIIDSENTLDLVYGDMIIVSVSENDALWNDKSKKDLAIDLNKIIKTSILKSKSDHSFLKLILRTALVLLVIAFAWLIIWLFEIIYSKVLIYIEIHKDKWLKSLSYKDYTFLSSAQEMKIILFLIKILHWLIYALILYLSLPIIFSIFPFSRDWADALFLLVWSPFRGLLASIWHYLPNLFSIMVIYIVMKYIIKTVRYLFNEIESEKLKISGFHADWAMPTYGIVKFLLYAFMFVLIFPYLPGSDSNIFKGVSVFIGVLISLGSSSAIANMVAGLVITYMRPFKIGDRIKIGEVSGDVIEKTLLVTRVKTIKNEIITIPNSSILSGNTINYSVEANETGLIIHTTVTIGYDVPWKDIHKALIDAALRTNLVMHEPIPFVLQTSLEDFYVAYQINAYTKEASKQALIYSNLHQNIQDVCNERGIEILSPHYRAARDGNMTSIPANYLPKDYKAPSFRIKNENNDKNV